jgi:hypothetical protein
MSQQKYQSLVTKENIDYCLSKLKDEDEKKDFLNVVSIVDIRIDPKPIIEEKEVCYKIWIWDRNTKRRKHFECVGSPVEIISILNLSLSL